MLAEADTQAASIRQQAADAAAITIEAAQQEGEEVRRQAADQASAMIAAAEKEIADRRAAILAMTAELGGMAAYITENLTAPPGAWPAARPIGNRAAAALTAAPAALPEAGPDSSGAPAALEAGGRAGTKPLPSPARAAKAATAAPARPVRKPRPDAKPGTDPGSAKGRQVSSMRKSMAVLATLIVVGGAVGGTEIGLHGLKFFLFRNTGAGAGNSQDLEENQGPGQTDAPGAHHDPVNPPAKGKHHSKGHSGKKNHHKAGQNGNGNGSTTKNTGN
jgi:hypothetical protein